MKHKLILILFAFFPLCLVAQNLSVYGVSLGDRKYKVQRVLENKGKSIKNGTASNGDKYLSISNVNIAGLDFNTANFYFKNNETLKEVYFISRVSGGLGDPGQPWEAEFHQLAKHNEYLFITMAQNLKIKYGDPNFESNDRLIWNKGKGQIELEHTYKFDENAYGFIDFWTRVCLSYKLIDVNSLDY